MSEDKINIAIAEACPDKFRNENGVWFFQYAKDCWEQCHNNKIWEDLNAMHEAEEVLNQDNLYIMALHIEGLCGRGEFYFRATARQRAEAFLRTLGKWDDQSGERTEMVKEVQK